MREAARRFPTLAPPPVRGTAGLLSLDDFLARRAADRRLARLTHDIPLPEAVGLEFGPGTNPVPLPHGHRVEYVDHAREGVTPGAVCIDHVWAGAGSLAAVCGRGTVYDFAIAAQVAQYVPNLLGWFQGVFAVLRVGGVLNLSLPDHRFMFDCARQPSTLGELVEAWHHDYARPSLRQLFDHTYGARAVEPGWGWAGHGTVGDTAPEGMTTAAPPRLGGTGALAFAHAQALEVEASGRYVTCHCWVFSPLSFLGLIEDAGRLGLFPFVVSQFAATEPGGFEFFVCLRRDVEAEPERLRGKQLNAIAHVRDVVEQQARAARRPAAG